MTLKNRKIRWLAALLALVMVIAMVPVGIIASGTSTLMGDPETIEVGRGLTARENNLNKGWKFYLGDNSSASDKNFDDSSWADVDLPHDFSITQNFTSSGEAESGFLPGGTGWYRKTLVMPEEADGKTFLLNFDGVYKDAYVYVNGTLVGEHHYGYSNFAIDITERLVCDGVAENVIAVKAVNNLPSSRWYSGSGIYRDVTLLVLDPVHVDLNGTQITTPDIASGSGKVNVKVDVVNDGATAVTATVRNTVYKKGSSSSVASAESTVTVGAGAVVTAVNAPVVSSPKLWDTVTPNLYTVKTEVVVGGKVVDTYETDFGFRWFSWSSKGFSLNGQNVKLNGVCLHHDQGAAGSAAYYDAMYRQLSIMKDMGCNAIRTSHNPADEDFIAICSELGLLVIEEHFDGITQAKNGNSNDFARYFTASVDTRLYGATADMICSEYVVRSIVKRDRNAPAVFAWSYGNEIQEGASTNANFATYCEKYITWINDEDGTRIPTIGDNTKTTDASSVLGQVLSKIVEAGGVAGFNYHCHQTNSQTLVSSWGGRWGCILASETSSHVNSRGFYQNQASASTAYGYHLTSYDTSAVHWGDNAHDSMYDTYTKDYIAGEFVWTGFDYIGEPTPWNGTSSGSVSGDGAIPNSSYFGIVETTGFEKDSYYLYRSQWNKAETTLHLVTAWDSDNYMLTSGKTPVWVYSNAPVVKLYRDGVHIGTATRTVNTTDAGHVYYTYQTEAVDTSICSVQTQSGADTLYAIFNVAYEAGTLSAKAFKEDRVTEIPLTGNSGKNTVTTPDTVTRLSATANRDTAPADGSSLIYVEVDVTDDDGNLDTTATNEITFSVSGPGEIVGVDNGDQATTAKYQNSSVKTSDTSARINAYAGKALVIVRTTEEAGAITVNVESSGLTSDSVTVTSQSTGDSTASQGLVSYTMVKDYTIKAGTAPALDTDASGSLSDNSTVDGTIAWDTVPQSVYGTAGDYTINGVLTLEGQEPIQVTAKLHVIPNVIALRNISAATMPGAAPTLPSTVRGVLADGTLAGEFNVAWNAPAASEYDTVGETVTVTGTAVIFDDETMDVTCTVRVAEALNAESVNVAPAAGLTQDIVGSDELESILNGVLKPGDNTDERWSNWDNRTNSAYATLTLTWATAQMIGSVNMYYYFDNCADYPAAVEFSYSLNGQEYTVIGYTSEELETYTIGSSRGALITYTFDQPINPVGLKVKLTQQNGTSGSDCVALNELEVMTYAASFNVNTSADLSGITVGGTAVENFAADTLTYETAAGAVAAETGVNAGITVLPIYQGVIRILTVAEDGSAAKTYEITQDVTDCSHDWDDGVITTPATPDVPGVKTYTCKICGETKTENVAYEGVPVPKVTLTVEEAEGHLVLKGTVVDYDEIVQTYNLVNHGILYIPGVQGELTESTSGRTRVLFSGYDDEGSYTYNLLPDSQSAAYTVRAFLIYVDPATGSEVTVYSETLTSQN